MPSVALVLDRFDPLLGGLEIWTHQLSQYLLEAGHEVHVVAFDFREPIDPRLIIHRLPKSSSKLERATLAEQCLGQLNVDVVHDMGVGWYFDILQPQAGTKYANYLYDLRSLSLLERLKRKISPYYIRWYREMRELEKRQYASSRGIFIAVSRMVQNHMQGYYKVDSNRVRLVYNGVDIRRFSEKDRAVHRIQIRKKLGLGEEVLFLLAEHNPRLKGIRTALKAVALLKKDHSNIHLALIGRGEAEIYKKMAKRWGITEQVTFCGFVDETMPYYLAADILVHPTFYDACSLVVLEAWASGLPVITTRFNGAGELMTPGIHGFLMEDPSDAEELARRMKLFLNASIRLNLGEEARSLGSTCSTEKNFKAIEKIYKEIS